MGNNQISDLAQRVLERMFIELEASARHVHVTKEQAIKLFGHDLTPERPLSQPGQYLARERLRVVGPKGELHNVAVLGPARKEAQVEVSMTDARALGLQPPIRESGRVDGSPGAVLCGPRASVAIDSGVIIAQRHLHLTPEAAERFGVRDGASESFFSKGKSRTKEKMLSRITTILAVVFAIVTVLLVIWVQGTY